MILKPSRDPGAAFFLSPKWSKQEIKATHQGTRGKGLKSVLEA